MRLITWNIQWGRGADGRVDLGRIVDTIQSMGAADVICLQEVAQNVEGLTGAEPDDGPAVLAAAFADYEPVFGPGVDVPARAGGRARFGNLMLSRLPVGQVFRHLLPFPADASVPGMQRGCIEAVVAAPSGPVRVLTTHLEYYSVRQRMAQVEALRGLQAERSLQERAGAATSKESCPVFTSRPRPPSAILCGDFNFEPDSPEHALMGESIAREGVCFVDAWRTLCGTVPHAPTVGLHGAEWPDRTYCCDFFWVSRDLVPCLQSITVDAATAASDHQPVLLEIDS
jgi:endonuclease/exonuclease/phosphatase family metal-dependent hydrolase